MNAAVKGVARPDQYVGCGAQIPKQAMRALSTPMRGLVRMGHDHHDVVVAVGPHVSPCARAKEIDAFWLACVNQALNYFFQEGVLDLRFDHPAHPRVSIHPNTQAAWVLAALAERLGWRPGGARQFEKKSPHKRCPEIA